MKIIAAREQLYLLFYSHYRGNHLPVGRLITSVPVKTQAGRKSLISFFMTQIVMLASIANIYIGLGKRATKDCWFYDLTYIVLVRVIHIRGF